MNGDHATAPMQGFPGVEPLIQAYKFGPFRIDVSARRLLRDNVLVPVTAKVFDTLLVLVKNHHAPMSKEDLMHAVWPDSFVSDDSLVQNISAIRRALGDDASQPQYITTLARRGYRFIGAVEEVDGTPLLVEDSNEIKSVERGSSFSPAVVVPKFRAIPIRIVIATLAGMIAIALIVASSWMYTAKSRSATSSLRFREILPAGLSLGGNAVLSPNGHQLAMVARTTTGESQIWVRSLDNPTAHPLAGTGGAIDVFWSPDSRFLGIFADGRLKRVSPESGATREIVSTQRGIPQGGSWGTSDLILYADKGKIFAVSASGGTPWIAAEPDPAKEQGELRWPHFLADGRHFVFFVSSENTDRAGIYQGEIGTRLTTRLVSGTRAFFAPPNHLLYLHEHSLMAQQFDSAKGVYGPPMTIASGISEDSSFSATTGGLLTFSSGLAKEHLAWVDRRGKELSTFTVPKPLRYLALSPSNKQLLGASVESGNWIIWLTDLNRNVSTEIVRDASLPVWAPDGLHFAYTSMRSGEGDIFVRSIAGSIEEPAWLKTDDVKTVEDWSSDGRFIVYTNQNQRNIWLLPTFGDRKPIEFLQAHGRFRNGKISPDRHWLAYVSDETGNNEVYLQSFPSPGSKRRVSTNGGRRPVWRSDGGELFYLSGDHQVMAVSVQNGNPSQPKPLFSSPEPDPTRGFAVTKDGQRFLVTVQEHTSDATSLTVLINWEAAQTP